ncbi:hypothetical protein [Arthrobacter sp. GN70]|uniref:Uncharacterized protein n=1 Tax=Arthrobacter terricola TaxID=2547396 RepID=A0A4R5KAN5_9MICC|nr:hypothetical protein [Arthrobacter sp. GN70]MBT8162237.1 hypothetical protein [Arthrobacter sp. GN70]TDF92283.1 hypothetical protein E1809_18765 [Arthrobacter terricola]
MGGLCDPKSSGTLATVSHAAVPGFPAASLVDVTMTNSTPGSADALYRSELIPTAAADALKVGDSACAETSYTNIVKLDASRGLELYYTKIIVNGAQTLNDVEAAQATSEYQQARQILLSTTH